MVREFAQREVAPYIQEWDAKGEFHRDVLEKMGELGILGLPIPEQYGGGGFDYVSFALACEELEYVDTFLRVVMSVHVGLNSLALLQWANEEQKQRWLMPQAEGTKFATFGLTEPGAGSDAGNVQSTAVRDGDSYILNGEKMWISLADVADHFLVFASHRPLAASTAACRAFVVERGMEGFTTGTIKGKLGVRAGNTGWLAFNNVRVPVENRIGEEGEGFKIAMSCIDQGRFTVAAGAVGLTRACLDASVKYCHEREAFGQEIGKFELVQQMIAKMVAGLRGVAPAGDEGRRAQEPRHPQHQGDLAGQVVRLRCGPEVGRRRDPDSRRLWLLQRVPGRALLAQRARRGDLRRHHARSTSSCRPTTRLAIGRTSRCAARSRRHRVTKRPSSSRPFRALARGIEAKFTETASHRAGRLLETAPGDRTGHPLHRRQGIGGAHMGRTVILGGARTPFGRMGGALADKIAVELGTIAAKEALNRSGSRPG